MKKLPLVLTLSLITPFAHADRILGLYAGAGAWNSDYDGKAGDPSISLKELGVKKDYNNYFFVALEHAVPFVPNIRFTQTNISSKQTGTISKSFTIGDATYTANESVKSDFDLGHRDLTLYYQLLDNWVNLDLGMTARKFDGYVKTDSTTTSEKLTVDETLPMLYGKAQFDLPFTGLSAGIEGNFTRYQDNSLNDYTAKITYLFDAAVDLGVEIGYRKMSLKISDNDLDADLTLKGPYAGLILHF